MGINENESLLDLLEGLEIEGNTEMVKTTLVDKDNSVSIEEIEMEVDKKEEVSEETENNVLEEDIINEIEDVPEIPNWVFPLDGVMDDGLEINETDVDGRWFQTYKYYPMKDPDGNYTGLFNCCCKDVNYTERINDNDTHVWIPMNGLLSKRYIVANVRAFVDNLLEQFNNASSVHVYHQPFKFMEIIHTDSPISEFEDEESRLIFQLMTGVDDAVIDNRESKLEILISNNYSGNRTIRLDFVVKTTTTIDGQTCWFRDFFTLSNHCHTLSHLSGSLGSMSTEISNIQGYIDSSVAILKGVTINMNQHIRNIGSKFSKKDPRTKFLSLCENLGGDSMNLFNVLILASIVVSQEFDFDSHLGIRSYVDKLHKTILSNVSS